MLEHINVCNLGEVLNKYLKMKGASSLREELNLNLRAASVVIYSRYEKICGASGVTASQYNVLRILKGVYPEGYARCEIALRMIEPSSDITRIIDRLEKQGLVERDRTSEDRRMSITRITKIGLKLVDELKPLLEKTHKEVTKQLTDLECEKLSFLLEKLYGHLI